MRPAPDDTGLTLDQLRSYMVEHVDDIEFYLDGGHVSRGHADVLSIRRNTYRNLIEIIDQGYIYNPPATDVTPEAGNDSLWSALVRKLRPLGTHRESAI